MHQDDRWHGSEDYPYHPPTSAVPDDSAFKALEATFGPPWNAWDTFLRRALMAGGVVLVWALLVLLVVAVIKGDIG